MNVQYIQDSNGKDVFVILSIEDFERLKGSDKYGFPLDDETDDELVDIPVEAGDNDDTEIPHDVISIMVDEQVNLLGAWRIYRGLSQYDVAEKTGLTQSAISQMERRDSKPQKKTLERFAKIYQCDVKQMYL